LYVTNAKATQEFVFTQSTRSQNFTEIFGIKRQQFDCTFLRSVKSGRGLIVEM
jgi:hypothetical protein